MDFDYKKYSLEKLNEWMHDAISCSEATPQEIYDVIKDVVSDNYYTYKYETGKCYELLCLLNGNGIGHIKAYDDYVTDPRGNVVPIDDKILECDKDDPSPECQKSWNSFWEDVDKNHNREYNLREAEYYNKRAELDSNHTPKVDGYSVDSVSHSEYWYNYDRNDLNRKNPFDKVVKWQLPVEVDGLSGECYVNFPDDLLEAANLKEGDMVEWVDNNDGSFTLRKS